MRISGEGEARTNVFYVFERDRQTKQGKLNLRTETFLACYTTLAATGIQEREKGARSGQIFEIIIHDFYS